jgi:hypothetical protein
MRKRRITKIKEGGKEVRIMWDTTSRDGLEKREGVGTGYKACAFHRT